MYKFSDHEDKTPVEQRKQKTDTYTSLIGRRPAAMAQAQRQAIANDSPQVKQMQARRPE